MNDRLNRGVDCSILSRGSFMYPFNGGDLCFINCDANIVSYYYGQAIWWLVLSILVV